jgi:hypothetical protein
VKRLLPLLAVLFVATSSRAADAVPRAFLRRVGNLVIEHRYPECDRLLDSLSTAYPCDGSVLFYRTISLYTWIDDTGLVDSLGGRFRVVSDSLVQIADARLKVVPNDPRARHLRGTVRVYRAMLRSHAEGISVGNVWGIYRETRRGMRDLEKALAADSTMTDIVLAKGNYLHWRSRLLPWPISDQNEGKRGMRMMEAAYASGLEWQAAGAQTLCWVYMYERRYRDVIRLALPMHRRYPHSRAFTTLVGRAWLEMGQLSRADSVFATGLVGLSAYERSNPFVVMKLERWRAVILQRSGMAPEACAMATRLKEQRYPGVHETWLRDKIGVVEWVARNVCTP